MGYKMAYSYYFPEETTMEEYAGFWKDRLYEAEEEIRRLQVENDLGRWSVEYPLSESGPGKG